MGCFSYKCQNCGKGVLSSSFGGEKVKIFLLKDSKVIQQMEGEYNSYGAVFKNNTQEKEVLHRLRKSVEWKPIDKSNTRDDAWSQICDEMFSEDISNGLAFIHTKCFTGDIPVVRSARDPNQGWGDEDDDGEYFSSTSSKVKIKKRKIVPNYCVLRDHGLEFLREARHELKSDLRMRELFADTEDQKQILEEKRKELVNIEELLSTTE